jgi:aspartate/methionine/tyrosine aminotransferase
MKLGWIACSGPADLAEPAMERLELIADTYLSVNTPVQRALPGWLTRAPAMQAEIRTRLRANREWLAKELAGQGGIRLLPSDGGWSAVLRVPGVRDDEEWALSLLERQRVRVHPGYLFDFNGPGHAVVSLLPPPDLFREAVRRLEKVV